MRRNDLGDSLIKRQNSLPETPEQSEPIIGSLSTYLAAEALMSDPDRDVNGIQNKRAERAMGVNMQPIDFNEVDGLTNFVNQPSIEVIR